MLHGGIAKSVAHEVRSDISAGKFEEASRKLDAARQAGNIGAGHEEGVVEQFQQLFSAPLLAKIDGVLDGGRGDAQATLVEVDSITKLLKWELPEELATARRALSILAECRRLRCTIAKPERRWTYGSTALTPSDASQGTSFKTVPSAHKLFVVARASAFSLVTLEEPAAGMSQKQRLLQATGWAGNGQLKAEDTIDWLLPGNELVGQHVFGPLRENDKHYYLGIVASVDGERTTVKRLSDEGMVTVSRSSLRSGRIASGTKVLAYCANPLKMEPAVIDREIPQPTGLPLVRVACPGPDKATQGPTRDEVPGAIVSKAEWLPRKRP